MKHEPERPVREKKEHICSIDLQEFQMKQINLLSIQKQVLWLN